MEMGGVRDKRRQEAGIEGNLRGKAHDRREWRTMVQRRLINCNHPSPLKKDPPLIPEKGMHEE